MTEALPALNALLLVWQPLLTAGLPAGGLLRARPVCRAGGVRAAGLPGRAAGGLQAVGVIE